MSVYKFLDGQERLTKKWFMRYSDAKEFAENNELLCLTFDYKGFVPAFEAKVARLEGHRDFPKFKELAAQAISVQAGIGHDAIAADDFMRRIIELPSAYIADWLDGKNNLEWLPEHLSERECDGFVTYPLVCRVSLDELGETLVLEFDEAFSDKQIVERVRNLYQVYMCPDDVGEELLAEIETSSVSSFIGKALAGEGFPILEVREEPCMTKDGEGIRFFIGDVEYSQLPFVAVIPTHYKELFDGVHFKDRQHLADAVLYAECAEVARVNENQVLLERNETVLKILLGKDELSLDTRLCEAQEISSRLKSDTGDVGREITMG